MNETQRIGIIGGMGPMAGVLLQKLIIDATPAETDQDHLQVVCFTNPKIPDRTRSLTADGGKTYIAAIRDTAQALIKMGVTILVIPCNTAHARFEEIQNGLAVPIFNMVQASVDYIAKKYGPRRRVGILVTDGLLEAKTYQTALCEYNLNPIIPSPYHQQRLMRSIYNIKKGEQKSVLKEIQNAISELAGNGAETVLLGCTELSLYFEQLQKEQIPIEDPLRVAAQQLVESLTLSEESPSLMQVGGSTARLN
ncbi:MAG: hypothetical protein A3C07_04360 [Candidatus Sungbacteria bacterium RIFCSPHIGHO2_02_FULL_47_11]|uniref:Aspartate racemase n=1 Tax=Candidatus Sungbacteria bacterium RIFCSPHIGHO2_02_FULL_47_11 TaxID=1802270 RepID=A0A1G2KML9_9BACT|nr:MAG: hypothetical protein A3C07_04360 [Candidatus Sungbacteria bacterium RIFCSPHIGHO2_02_FULL_47_11]